MNFSAVIECLKKGGYASRSTWHGNQEIVMQIPQCIAKDVVPKMTSLPEAIKPKISTVGSGEISYHDQVIMITFTDDDKTPASATYYIPSWEDILAEDWSCTIPADKTETPDNRPVTERIKTFDDACGEVSRLALAGDQLANNLLSDVICNTVHTPDLLAYLQLRIITYALNEGWKPQFLDNEKRYYPYYMLYTKAEIDALSDDNKAKFLLVKSSAYENAQCGISPAYSTAGSSRLGSSDASRLALKSRELAIYAGNQFREIYYALLFKTDQE